MSVFLSDTFTDTNGTLLSAHTPETGGSWTKRSGFSNLTITSNKAVGSSNFNNVYTNAAVPGGNEYDIEYDLTPSSGYNNDCFGRFVDLNNYFRCVLANNFIYFYKKVSGTETLITFVGYSLNIGVVNTVKFEIRDAAKKVYIDSVEKISTADDSITDAGIVGIGGDSESKIDNLVSTDSGVAEAETASMQTMNVWWPR